LLLDAREPVIVSLKWVQEPSQRFADFPKRL
jgi:hypothetical protein